MQSQAVVSIVSMYTASTAQLFLVICGLCAAAPRAFSAQSYSMAQYAQELDRLALLCGQARSDRSAAQAAIEDLHGGWKVEDHGQMFDIDTTWMEEQFERLRRNSDNQVYDQLIQHVRALAAEAQAFHQEPLDTSSAHAMLKQILARSEFHQVRGPTWLDRLILKVELWIVRLLSRSLGSSSVPAVGRIFVYTLVVISLGVLALLVYRSLKRSAQLETIVPRVLPVSAKQWRIWMEEAQTAATAGLWRDAVHLAYWAGISFLEENGRWRPDQARTPREYLRLLAPGSNERSTLSALTGQLEKMWYGKQPAGPEGFAESLAHLEKLGCRQA